MKYTSTRLKKEIVLGSNAILTGLAGDGGLFVPINVEEYFSFFEKNVDGFLNDIQYQKIAKEILKIYFDEFDDDMILESVNKAYSNFYVDTVCPTTKVGDDYLLELYHGPTSAFKDVALTMLPYLMKMSYKMSNVNKKIYILCATSGDTGKAALEGLKNINDIYITVFYPYKKVSYIQELQMVTTEGNNTNVVSLNGNFDDCQKLVKKLMNEKENLLNSNTIFSSSNSINIGRLVPQIVYYFYSYVSLLKGGKISKNQKVNFSVPSGNFGDIFAGYLAKKMGLPINKLIVASNKNNVLTDFINTGIYDRNRILYSTISPSMDILLSSNVERLLYFESNNDKEKVAYLMNNLDKYGKYEIDKKMQNNIKNVFSAYYVSEEEAKNIIKKTYIEKKRIVDPHTACAIGALDKYKKETNDDNVNIILSTASVYKFVDNVLPIISNNITTNDYFEKIKILYDLTKEEIPINLKNLKNLPIKHKDNINFNEGFDYIKRRINEI